MPILSMNMGECPGNAGGVKAFSYPGILIYVLRIVVVNEIMPQCLAKNGPGKQRKTDANAENNPTAGRSVSSYRLSSQTMHASPRIRDTSTMTRSELQTANEPRMT